MYEETSGDSGVTSDEEDSHVHQERLRWKKKYTLLLKRTENVEKQNMRLINRIHQIKNITKITKREKRGLMRRLDQHDDSFRKVRIFTNAELLPEGLQLDDKTDSVKTGGEEVNDKTLLGLPPQKPMSAFFRYCQAQHLQILQKSSTMPHDAIKKSLAEKWTTIPQSQKNRYFAQFEDEQNVYETEMNNFLENFQQNTENTCNALIRQEPEVEEESIIEEEEEEEVVVMDGMGVEEVEEEEVVIEEEEEIIENVSHTNYDGCEKLSDSSTSTSSSEDDDDDREDAGGGAAAMDGGGVRGRAVVNGSAGGGNFIGVVSCGSVGKEADREMEKSNDDDGSLNSSSSFSEMGSVSSDDDQAEIGVG